MLVPQRPSLSRRSAFLSILFFVSSSMHLLASDSMKSESSNQDSPESVKDWDSLQRYAHALSKKPYVPSPVLPPGLQGLTYDEYRLIAFDLMKGVWKNQSRPFWLEFFHRGFVHQDQVAVNLIADKQVSPLPFSRDYFEYRGVMADREIPPSTGFAGLRVAGFFPNSDDPQEILTYVGSSYFRARTASSVYGTSSRGLAVNIGMNKAEEFPAFREFWVIRPANNDRELQLLALLDGESVTGAYQMTLQLQAKSLAEPEATHVDVKAKIYFRQLPEKLGIAPLTSMWMWGDGLKPPPLDSRPKVHDADGLLVRSNENEWSWRALNRQNYPSLTSLKFEQVDGFGLMQRDSNYNHYLDDEAKYDRRPSVWVTPSQSFKSGHIELLELPGVHEGIDNIAAYWVPEKLSLSEPLELEYRVSYFRGNHPQQNWLATAQKLDVSRFDETVRLSVEFEGPAIEQLSQETPLDAELTTIRGEVVNQQLVSVRGGSRTVIVDVRPTEDKPFEIRMALKDANRTVSETWNYLCPIKPPKYHFPQVYTRIE